MSENAEPKGPEPEAKPRYKTAEEIFEELKAMVRNSALVPCSCCRIIRKQESVGEVRIYEPLDPALKARMRGVGAVVVCKECVGVPADEQRKKIDAFMVEIDAFRPAELKLFLEAAA